MAEQRSFLKRSLEILGGTAIDIGKDYTSNIQTLKSDAENIKSSITDGIGTAKDTFTKLKSGQGPIKGLLNWFYNKEGETDMWDLDDPDSDFDAGFDLPDDEENEGPGTLDLQGAKDIARGQANSMYKIATKIAETQVANTSEIISTLNSRTSEIIAATNNINTTLMGISKKLDAVIAINNQPKKKDNFESLYDYNGRLTLGSVFDASKRSVANNDALSMLSLVKTMGGMMGPQDVLRMAFDWTIGSKDRKWLGNQSINEVGEKINDAIGQTISDVLDNVISTKTFKKIFGDLKKETRSTNFETYIKNEYTKDPAVFDGMTRTSIVKVIPEYLKLIYQGISGTTINVDKSGNLTTGPGNTWAGAVKKQTNRTAFSWDTRDYATDYIKEHTGQTLKSSDATLLGLMITQVAISMMADSGLAYFNKDWLRPDGELQRRVLWYFRQFGDKYGGRTFSEWVEITRVFLMSLSLDRTQKNKLAAEINEEYQRAMKELSGSAQTVRDQNKVDKLGGVSQSKALLDIMNDRGAVDGNKPGYNTTDTQIKSFVTGNGPETSFSMSDTLSDIKTLLSAGVQKLIGNKRFAVISGKLKGGTTGIVLDASAPFESSDIVYDQDRDKQNKQQSRADQIKSLQSELSMEDAKAGLGELGKAIKSGVQTGKGYLSDAVKGTNIPEWYGRMQESDAYKAAMEAGGNAVDAVKSAWGSAKVKAYDALDDIKARGFGFMNSRFEKTVDWAKEHGNNHDQEIVAMIASYIQASVQNGAVSQDEKNSIHRLIDSIEDSKLKAKLSKSVDTMLKHASWKAEGEGETGKKSILGKVLAGIGLLLSPLNLIKKAIVTFVPMIGRGIWNLSKKLFAPDLQNIRAAGHVFSEGWQEFREGRREYREYKRTQDTGKVYNRYTGQDEDRYGLKDVVSESWNDADTLLGKAHIGLLTAKAGVFKGASKVLNKAQTGIDIASELLAEGIQQIGEKISPVAKKVKGVLSSVGGAIATGIGAVGKGIHKFMSVPGIISKTIHKIGDKAIEASEENGTGRVAKWLQQRRSKKEEKGENRATFWAAFKEGVGAVPDAIQAFKDAAGIKTGGGDRVEGIDEAPQTFTDKVLAKLYNFFKKNREDDEAKEEQEKKEAAVNTTNDENQIPVLSEDDASKIKGLNDQESQNAPKPTSPQMESIAPVTNAVGQKSSINGATPSNDLGGQITEGASAVAAKMTDIGGSIGGAAGGAIGKIAPMITKIAGGVGKMVGSLGSIGLSVLKLVGKAILMLSGFKALTSTISSISGTLIKIIQIGLQPLNKIFHAINKILKPLIKMVSGILKSIMKGISTILDAVLRPLMKVLNNVISPVLTMLQPVLDVIMKVLEPLFDLVEATVNLILAPMMGIFKYVVAPVLTFIKYAVQGIMGVLETGIGWVMSGLGSIISSIGGILKFFGGGSELADSGQEMVDTGKYLREQGPKDMKEGFSGALRTIHQAFRGEVPELTGPSDISVENPNATEASSIGSVMDGYASGDTDSHNMTWNIQNIYGSGNRSQGSYGGALSMRENGCGPMALADAYNRRTGSSVDGLSLARSMSRSGSYEPGRGTSVGSFTNSARALGMGLTPGGVTQASLKHASPNNPITVIGSGSDFGTRKGNNHYMNVIGTDRYGGAYVSNPMTGRIDRRSASTLASSSVLGLYGSGDSDYYQFPDDVTDAISELKNLAKSLLGIFTGPSTSDTLSDTISSHGKTTQLSQIENQIAAAHEADPDNVKTWPEYLQMAHDSAFEDWSKNHSRKNGETEDEYNRRFEKWYTDDRKYDYLVKSKAISEITTHYNNNKTNAIKAFEAADEGYGSAFDAIRNSINSIQSKDSGGGSSSGGGIGGPEEFVESTAKIFEGLVDSNPKIGYSNSTTTSLRTRDGKELSGVRPDCSGIIGASIYNMGYTLSGKDARGLVTQDLQTNKGDNSLILNADGSPSSDWKILPFNSADKQPGDIIVASPHHMGMYIKDNPNGGNYGFDGGAADSNSNVYTGALTGGIHGSAKYAKMYLDATGSITDRYKGTIWTQPDSDADYIIRYVKPKSAGYGTPIEMTDLMRQYSGWNDSYAAKLKNSSFHSEAQKAGLTGGQEAMVAGMGLWEDSLQKLTGEKSLTKVTRDYTGQYAFGLMNWIPDGSNQYLGADETKYGSTLSEQLPYMVKSYFSSDPTHPRAYIVNPNFNDSKDAIQQVIGHRLALNVGDPWGQYADKDVGETMGHYVANALVPVDSYRNAAGQAKYIGTTVDIYNWMIENGWIKKQATETPLDEYGLSDDDYETIWVGNSTVRRPKSDSITKNAAVSINSESDAKQYMSEQFTAQVKNYNSDPAIIRSTTAWTSDSIGQIPAGTKIKVTRAGTSGDWWKVTYNGKTGYVRNSALMNIKSTSTDRSTKPNGANASNVYAQNESPSIVGTNNNYITNTRNYANGGTYGTVAVPQISTDVDNWSRSGGETSTWIADTDNLSGAVKKLYGKGDSDIPPIDDKNFIYDEYTKIAMNTQAQDERISKLMNHTYEVHAEGVERLLERIIDIIDKKDDPNPKPVGSNESMFKDNSIPKAVQRLSQ